VDDPAIPVIVMSMSVDEEEINQSYQMHVAKAGIPASDMSDYMTRRFSKDEIKREAQLKATALWMKKDVLPLIKQAEDAESNGGSVEVTNKDGKIEYIVLEDLPPPELIPVLWVERFLQVKSNMNPSLDEGRVRLYLKGVTAQRTGLTPEAPKKSRWDVIKPWKWGKEPEE
jgi:CheY-like chemotaxis protein